MFLSYCSLLLWKAENFDTGFLQGMWAVCTLGRTILWNHTGYVWPITLSSHMISTRRWKFMLVITTFSFSNFVTILTVICFNLESLDDCFRLFFFQRPHKAYPVELAQFHSADYVEFLHRITPDKQHLFSNELARCMIRVDIVSFLLLCMPWLFLLWAWTQKSVFNLVSCFFNTSSLPFCELML